MLEYYQRPDLDKESQRLSQLLETEGFQLQFLPDDDDDDDDDDKSDRGDAKSSDSDGDDSDGHDPDTFGTFVVLQFPALDRTLSQRSLFDIAYALQAELELVSVEPDIESRVYVDPTPPATDSDEQTEGVIRDAFNRRCWVRKNPPDDRRWALEAMRIPAAWQMTAARGEGVIIAQPDTGIAAHEELSDAALRLDLSSNLVEGGSDPVDPLHENAANPGHGTATASVIISTAAGVIHGAAPGASLVPIRCVDDVKIFEATPVTAAINHARIQGCHVISMSLGGLPSRAMKKAIRRAVARHMIVITAAGNCVDQVVWPARYPDVIAIGGSNVDDSPWKGTSFGEDVDVSAPAELVWVAKRRVDDPEENLTTAAQGTSFATALTAGVAALWLSHHARDVLVGIAEANGMTLQSLFRLALVATARTPAGWQSGTNGAGIVDAEALLALDPQSIVNAPAPTRPGPSRRSPAEVLLASLDNIPSGIGEAGNGPAEQGASATSPHASGSLARFEQEIGAALLESARLGTGQNPSMSAESITNGKALSSTLAGIIKKSNHPSLHALRTVRQAPPAARVSQALLSTDAEALARVELAPRSSPDALLGRGGKTASAKNGKNVHAHSVQQHVDALARHIDKSPQSSDLTAVSKQRLKDEVLQDTEEVLERLRKGETIDPADVRATTGLEALVKMKGRPAIRLDGNPIDIDNPDVKEWAGILAMLPDRLPKLAQSVGRIDAEGMHQGTGFVVAPGIVMTNRHVVEGFAAPIPSAHRPDRWLLEQNATINFSPGARHPDFSFRVQDVLFSGPDPISGDPLIDHAELDLALLAVETVNNANKPLPDALPLDGNAGKTDRNSKLFLIGYPAAPSNFPTDENGLFRVDVVERIRQLFGMDYGVSYLSPGLVDVDADAFDLCPRPISFSHDATSLGGSSGSCLLSCDSDLDVIGLHYGGDWLRANFAHDVSRVSKTLIDLRGLVETLSSSKRQSREHIASAARANQVDPDGDLSAAGLGNPRQVSA